MTNHMPENTPTAEFAAAVVRRSLGTPVQTISRFPTGLAHYVFDVLTVDGRRVVVRLARSGQEGTFASAMYWHQRLVPRGVPLPALLAVDVKPSRGSFPFMLMDRLPGRDLGEEYLSLSVSHKRRLAEQLAHIQQCVSELPPGPGFGYARSYDDPSLHASWADVLHDSLERSRMSIQAVKVVPARHVDRVAQKVAAYAAYFAAIQPTAFLDDTTTKNVLVHHGELSGIVDVDVVCFGDPLFTLALTKMALLKRRYTTDYISFWSDALRLTAEQRTILSLYTAIFCVDFLGELGQRFNQDVPTAVDDREIDHLVSVLDRLLAVV
jgi:Ser/Thr protein kinase RdoA (MazF antagonist)